MPLLEVLSVKGNFLKFLPSNLSKLHKLKKLSLDDNNLEQLDLDGDQLTSLTYLSAAGNKLRSSPPSLVKLVK